MILTGKCKEDFYNYYNNSSEKYLVNYINCEDLPSNFLTTLIIDFFDSVGICIHPRRSFLGAEFKHWYFVITDEIGCHLNNFMEVRIKNDSRQEAKTEAIKKANEIYNDKY